MLTAYRFKVKYKNVCAYSMPTSILFIVRKRLNLINLFLPIFGLGILGII